MAMLPCLTKEDLRDLFPGPEHFLRRKNIWDLVHGDSKVSCNNIYVLKNVLNASSFMCFVFVTGSEC